MVNTLAFQAAQRETVPERRSVGGGLGAWIYVSVATTIAGDEGSSGRGRLRLFWRCASEVNGGMGGCSGLKIVVEGAS